ncbi:calcineurin-like phosphoesterase C-terminal domain-containing protein [Lichenifustis flavocetrariae]|uniref:Calcineurin-like phosphoesterase C-terminal domain-containing protein n=1 Tax=Lichenifustis flavocetrariae TaxID=2949735 RepID=A0AA42CHF2_9HYPH|nr:calcineurin-like phosphoesterase C-terminal domain-containing protein [Lichenifustis flavocetrariae]MCW6507488.1 calcineurin-like phosphoesterase C-terminal domain-containing protein [Lichenifustis flavocetrariae]
MPDTQVKVTRRDMLLAAAASGIAAALPEGAAQAAADAPTVAAGLVFETEAGVRKGVPGVLVSNGRDVTVTDGDGRYTLPVSDETVVFVIKPAGFMTPVDPVTQLPRFYYIHQPQGSPASLNLTFEGIAPTGPLPSSIDFELHRQDEPKAFEVVLFTDPQPESDAEVDFIREDVVEALSGTSAKFGLTSGDIMFDDLSLYDRLTRIIGTIGIPWYNVGGNHDFNFEAPGRRYSRETFKRVFGPPNHAFAYADAVFLMLDDVEYLGPDPDRPKGKAPYFGKLEPDTLTFVRNVLAHVSDDKLIVIVLHIPLKNDLDATPENNLTNRADLFQLFEGRRFTLSLSGHTHTTEHHYFAQADGWPSPVPHHHHVMTAVSGSWWSGPYDHRGVAVADSRDGTPNGFHILSVDGNSYKTRFVPAKEPNARQVRLSFESHFHGGVKEVMRDFRLGQLIQSPVQRAAVGSTTLVANVFDGGPKTQVTLRIGSGEPIPMTRNRRPDPFVEDVFDRNEAVKKPWIKAEPSTHVWTARLPATLPAGTHRLTVTALTEYGDTVRGTTALEIVG